MCLLKALKLLNICSSINDSCIYSCVFMCVSLQAAQADINLPSPEEIHENSAPTVSLSVIY